MRRNNHGDSDPAHRNSASDNPWMEPATGALFILMAAIWFFLALSTFLRGKGFGGDASIGSLLAVAFMVGNALGFLLLGWGIRSRKRLWTLMAYPFLAVNILLTITDEFGAWDLITLLIDVSLLILLVLGRKRKQSSS